LAGFQLFLPSEQWNFKKKSSACSLEHAWSMIIKQFFVPLHTVGSRVMESKKQSNHVKSYNVLVQHYGGRKNLFFTNRDVRTGRAFEIINKMTVSQNHRLTSFDSTNNRCSLDLTDTTSEISSTHFALHTTTLLGLLRRDESFCLIALTTRSLLQFALPCWV
jgi:hypothetical protein